MILDAWFKKWNIQKEAIDDLINILDIKKLETNKDSISNDFESESELVNKIRLEACRKGYRLWRNNLGATKTLEGNFVRYGLANDSKIINKEIKSSDLIGIKPVFITQDMVGKKIGQFLSVEIKSSNWSYTGTPHEEAQLRWIMLINSLGGDAGFINKEGKL